MKTFLAAIALALCIHLPINGQRPDDVYSIGKTNFAFYQAKNQTEVMSHAFTIFDNSSRDFPYIGGTQRLELFLIHKFAGRTLTQTPPSIQLVFESRSKLSRKRRSRESTPAQVKRSVDTSKVLRKREVVWTKIIA